jgi:class 3 adenylate cyclase/tetratricopeptide (TPR) repeat protein
VPSYPRESGMLQSGTGRVLLQRIQGGSPRERAQRSGASVTGILDWLAQLGLEKYAAVFAEHEITLEVLPHLTEPDIDRLALPTGPRRRLMVAIQALSTGAPLQSSVEAPETPLAQPANAHDAERRQLTVMFCDLVGSTALSERLDPEELRELMQAYRKAGGEVVARYEGHVAQYLGDGLMVYFGWPSAHEDDAERCVRAGLEIVQAVKGVSAAHPLAVRIGVATGTVVVGEASRAANAEAKLAVGDTPNLAARLQGLAGPDEVVIAPATRRLLGDAFDLTDLGTRPLKGIAEPVRVWRVEALHRTDGRFESAHAGVALTPLVGREEELALLMRAWRQAREGEGRVVLISGEPGIGKSRLIQVLREQIAGERYTGLRYQCSPYHLNSALYPITEELEFAAGFAREDTPEQKLDKIEAVLVGSAEQRAESTQLLAALLSLPAERYPGLKVSPQKWKEKTLEALASQVEALSRRRPVLMVFEDTHWIDPTSQEALDVLVPRLHALSVLLVITYRPEYMPRWAQQAHVTILGLSRLGRRQGVDLVAKVTRGRALPPEVLEQILAHTDGVPLFVEELTKSVLESGLLHEAGDQYTLRSPLPALAIPTSLRDSLLARLDRLAPVKHILQIGACVGREFSYELLARISALPDEQLEAGLRTLTEAGLVYRRGMPPDASYTFKHALVQDAAYDSLLKSKRQQLHAQLAQVLEVYFTDRVANEPELLAHHYTQAGNLATAIPRWREAGGLAVERVALQEAVAHFQRGLALIEQLPPSSERDGLELTIREPLNAAWTGLRGWAAPEVSLNAAALLELAKRRGKSHALGVGLWAIWVNTITQGRVADSLKWAQGLLDEGDQAGDIDLRIFGHGAAMISHFYLGQLLEAQEHGNRVLALYDPLQAGRWMLVTGHDLRTLVGVWSSQWTWMLGYPDRAVQLSEETDAHAHRLGHTFNLGFALTLGGYAFDYRCEHTRLFERIGEADRLEREHSVPFMNQVMVPQVEGLARLRSGQLPEAVSSLRRGLENWNRRGGHSRVPYLKSALAEAQALQGDLDAAREMIDECLEQIERPGWQERSHLAEVLRLKGWMLMRQGRGEEAETALRAATDWARRQQAKSWELRASTTLAELLVERGQRDAARWLLAPIYNWFTEGFDTHDLTAARKLLEALQQEKR